MLSEAELKDKAAIFLEKWNVSGDTMVEMDHFPNKAAFDSNKGGSLYLHDLLAEFAKEINVYFREFLDK